MKVRILILSVTCVFLTTSVWAAKVHLKDGTVISGKIEKSDAEKIELITPLGVKMTIPRESVTEIIYEPREVKTQGNVVKVEGEEIYIDLGFQDGVNEGTIFKIYREEKVIHAKTGEFLKTVKVDIGKVKVVKVYSRSSIAKVLSLNPNEQVEIGDIVEVFKQPKPIPEKKVELKAKAEEVSKGPPALIFPMKAVIHENKGTTFRCIIKKIRPGFVEYKAGLLRFAFL